MSQGVNASVTGRQGCRCGGKVLVVDITAVVTTPTLKKYRPSLVNNQNGTVTVHYTPSEPGAHTLELSYAGVPVQDSPYKFTVEQVKPGCVSAFGPGLSSGLAGLPTSFTVVTKDAGPGRTFIHCISQSLCLCACLSVSVCVCVCGGALSVVT